MRPATPLEKWIVIAVWKLTTPDSYRGQPVVRAISTFLLCWVICMGDPHRGICHPGLPQLQGDGHRWSPHSHPCPRPLGSTVYKSQGILFDGPAGPGQPPRTAHGHFLQLVGKAHDAHVFRKPSLYQKLEAGTFFPEHIRVVDVEVPLYIVGDVAYPLMPYTSHQDPSRDREHLEAGWNPGPADVAGSFSTQWSQHLIHSQTVTASKSLQSKLKRQT
ncbi:uncharacterized protein LOC142824494 [Pelodiscus sinensis]|uniref:uncharacterized protein LOC142824494 n=1 Tax=Pelodiscus sinensis TaxID=13735 RepID=UPI003F6BC248